ncbi:hypothetical protein D9M68_736560 [compost metagenome]
MRSNLLFLHKPGQIVSGAIGTVGDQIAWLQAKAVLCSVDHGARSANLSLSNGTGGLDIENDAMVGVDQIVGGVGEEGMAFMGTRPLGCRV